MGKVRRRFVIIFILLIFLIGLINASPRYYTVQGKDYNLRNPAYDNNNAPATNAVSCYITVRNPNSTIIVDNELMDWSIGGTYNYTIAGNTLDLTGEYPIKVDCSDSSYSGFDTFTLKVTPTGEELTQSNGIIYLSIFVISIILLAFTVLGAIKMPFRNKRNEEESVISINNLKYLKIVLWVFAYLEFLFIIFMIKNVTFGYANFQGAYQLFNIMFTIMLSSLLVMFPLLIFFTVVIYLTDKKFEKSIERGINYE